MNKMYLLSMFAFTAMLASCAKPVGVAKGDVTVVGAPGTETTDKNYRFNETYATGVAISSTSAISNPQSVIIPEKATAICNDGTFSMSLLNEACLNNGGVKEAIKKYYSE